MARIIMLQKRNTNWLSRKIEAQRERSGVRGKGLGGGFRGRGFGVPPTNRPGWLQGCPLTIPDTPSLLLFTGTKISGFRRTNLLRLISEVKLSALSFPLSLLIVLRQKSLSVQSTLSPIPHAGPSLRVNVFETERPSYAYFITQLWEAYSVSELLAAHRCYRPAGLFRELDRFHHLAS